MNKIPYGLETIVAIQVKNLLSEGLSFREIAWKLNYSSSEVEWAYNNYIVEK